MTESHIRNVIEAALLAAGKPLQTADLVDLFDEGKERPTLADVQAALAALAEEYSTRGIEIKETAAGFRIQVRADFSNEVSRLWPERPAKYSRALLETLAIIAYRQPITRAEIEAVRGVPVNPNIVKTIVERNWVHVVGHRDVPGRPELLATTRDFLDYFGLKRLDELPPLAEVKALGEIKVQFDLPDPGPLALTSDPAAAPGEAASADAANAASSNPEATAGDAANASGSNTEASTGDAANASASNSEATAADAATAPGSNPEAATGEAINASASNPEATTGDSADSAGATSVAGDSASQEHATEGVAVEASADAVSTDVASAEAAAAEAVCPGEPTSEAAPAGDAQAAHATADEAPAEAPAVADAPKKKASPSTGRSSGRKKKRGKSQTTDSALHEAEEFAASVDADLAAGDDDSSDEDELSAAGPDSSELVAGPRDIDD